MPISNDWDIDYTNKEIRHVDGVLTYSGGTGTQPAVGEYIRGGTSGAVGRVIAKTGTAANGTLSLTDVVGQFASSESLSILGVLNFDTVSNGGFSVGDTLVGQSSAKQIVVRAIEYNQTSTAGWGRVFGALTGAFINNEDLDISGGTSNVADADGTGTDNASKWTGATASGPLAVPGTAGTNNSIILHYDAGTIAIPADAKITGATSGAYGYAQKVVGAVATGSIRVVDYNSTVGVWANDETIRISDVVFYQNLVSGKVFEVGQVVHGATSGKEGRVLMVIVDSGTAGKLVLADKSGAFTSSEDLQVKVSGVWTKYGEVNGTTDYLAAATTNLPTSVRSVQLATQGGIYGGGTSLNIVRSSNALYTYLQGTFDELSDLDDKVPVRPNFKDLIYTLINGWRIPDLSFRFLEKGSWKDETGANIWTNYQSLGTLANAGNHGYLYSAANPTPQPNLYVEQDGDVLPQFWLEGHVDVNIKVKTSTDPKYISPSTPALGQLINNGEVTWFAREYLSTYDNFTSTTVGGTAPIPLSTKADANNFTGTHRISYTGTGGFTIGEEIVGGTSGARGIVTAEDTVGNTLDYALKTTTQFSGAETITGQVSAATATFSSVADLVAGYGVNIRVMTVDRTFTGGSVSGTFVYGETLTQAVSGWTGYFMGLNSAGDALYVQDISGTPGTQQITGGVSSATYTPSANSSSTTVPYDLGDGSGWTNYSASIAADITNSSHQGIASVYEWVKYLTRKESTTVMGGPGTSTSGVQGRMYRRLDTSYAEAKESPWGTFAGAGGVGKMFGARGVFIIKETLDSADVQNFYVTNNAGSTLTPPNLQSLLVSVPEAGVRCVVYRADGVGSTDILRTEFKVGAVGGGYNQSANTKILVAANTRTVGPLPADVPSSGSLRVLDPGGSGTYLRFAYTSVDRTNNYFNLSTTIGAVTGALDLVLNNNVHVCLLGEEETSGATASKTIQYVADIPLYWASRKKGYQPASGTATFGAAGASISTNMQADDVVNLP